MRATALLILSFALGTHAAVAGSLCQPLRIFIESIQAGQSSSIEFHTSWGEGFKGDTESSVSAKRCVHHGYKPAKAVCAFVMEHGAIEFSGNNAKSVISCLSPHSHFAPHMLLDNIAISFPYGTVKRGSNVSINFAPDAELGGMVLTIRTDGY